MHKFLTLILLACTTLGFSQSVTLKGKVTDSDNLPLEAATVYLTSAKDSAVIDYAITNKNGLWEMKTRAINKPVFLKISFVSFNDHKKQYDNITESTDFGSISLSDQSTTLDNVVIEGETPPIRIKADTLEFNASSFKVRPDANVEAMLKQLPGVDVDADGKITVNGKEVNQILVNGKPFFDKDGKVALQNLPADIINKVQVTDTKTKTEELTGQKASGNNASINLTIDEEKNKGIFGKVMGGYGTNDRYESSAIVNYFKGKQKLSVLASSNNINATGFSMNEIFDSMGGGRNNSVYSNGDGNFNINGIQFGGSGKGITKSNMVGLNYADEWAKGFDGSGNYFYGDSNTKNNNRSRYTRFLSSEDPANPGNLIDESYTINSQSRSTTSQYSHNFNTEFNVKIDSTSTIYFAPKFAKANSKVINNASQASQRLSDDRLLNDSNGLTNTENDNNTFSSTFVYSKALGKKGRSFDVGFENENRKNEEAALNKSTTNTYTYDGDGNQNTATEIRNQIRYNKQSTDKYAFNVEYREPLTDSLQVKVGVRYDAKKAVENRDGFDYDAATGRYSSYNDPLSNYLTNTTNTLRPTAGIQYSKSKIWLGLEGGTGITDFNNSSYYIGTNYSLKKQYVMPYAQAQFNYKISKSKSIWVSYNYDVQFPTARQVLPVDDISNPLYIFRGNPDLDPQKTHNVYLNYNNYDYATRSGFYVYAGGNYNDTDIATFSEIDESAKSVSTYKNVSGTFYSWLGGSWSKSIKKDAHTYRFSVGTSINYSGNKGFLNNVMFDSKTIGITPRLNFTYQYGELLTINPSYNFTYNETNYNNYQVTSASNFVHRLNLQTTSYFPKHFVFGNDFGYTYNSQLGAGFKKDFYLWNSSLGYNFYGDKLLFKVKVYDILNQNLGTSRTIDATSITDQQNTVLKRYAMFSLTFKLDKFGKKKKDGIIMME